MKHRRPVQHWRMYRSGRHTFVNRGIKYLSFCEKEIKEELQKLKKRIGHGPPFTKEEIKQINKVLDKKYYKGFWMKNPEVFILSLPNQK